MTVKPGLQSVHSLCLSCPISVQPVTTQKNTNWRNGLLLHLIQANFFLFIVADFPYRIGWEVSQCIPAVTEVPRLIYFLNNFYLSVPVRMSAPSHEQGESTRYKYLDWWQHAGADVAHSPLTQPWHLLTFRWSNLRESAAGWKGIQAKRRLEWLNGRCT